MQLKEEKLKGHYSDIVFPEKKRNDRARTECNVKKACKANK